jgi:hypothetical protein
MEGLSAAALPGLASPRLTFTGRLRGDKAPDVLIEALALIGTPPPAYLVGDGPLRGPLTRLIRARGLEAVVHLPGWSYEPARDIAQATVHVVPSREESWSQSAVLALGLGVPVVGTAVDGLACTLGAARGVLVPAEAPRTPSPGRCRASWPASAPTPPSTGPAPAVHPQRSGRGTGQRLPPAARQPRQSRGSHVRHGLVTSAFWCRSWSWAAVLTEMTAPAGRQVTASGGRAQGHSAGAAARAAAGRLTRLGGAPRHDAAAPGRTGDLNPAGLGLR